MWNSNLLDHWVVGMCLTVKISDKTALHFHVFLRQFRVYVERKLGVAWSLRWELLVTLDKSFLPLVLCFLICNIVGLDKNSGLY